MKRRSTALARKSIVASSLVLGRAGLAAAPSAARAAVILQDWKEGQFEALIAANIRAADIQINHTVFDKVVTP